EIILKFDNPIDYILDVSFNPKFNFEIHQLDSKRKFLIKFFTQREYYGVCNLKIQIKDNSANHLFKQPIEIPILILPTEEIEKEVKF
ncbi:MAG: hypothetical protein ABIL72_01370, partial [candidate division WOR-3 bacterium]